MAKRKAKTARRSTRTGRFTKKGSAAKKVARRTRRTSPLKGRRLSPEMKNRRRIRRYKGLYARALRSRKHPARRPAARKWLSRAAAYRLRGARGKFLPNPRRRRRRRSRSVAALARRHPSRRYRRNPDGPLMDTAIRVLAVGGGFYGGRLAANLVRRVPLAVFQTGKFAPTLTAGAVFALAWFTLPKSGAPGRYRGDLLIGLGINALDQAIKWLVPEGAVKQAIGSADGLGDIYEAAAGYDQAPYRSLPAASDGTGAYYQDVAAGDFQEATAAYYETGEPIEGVGAYYETDAAGALAPVPGAQALPPPAASRGVTAWGDATGARETNPVGKHEGRQRPGGIFRENVFGI